jgi:hypothetical protein
VLPQRAHSQPHARAQQATGNSNSNSGKANNTTTQKCQAYEKHWHVPMQHAYAIPTTNIVTKAIPIIE